MKASEIREHLHFYVDEMSKKDLKKDYFRLDVYVGSDSVDVDYSDYHEDEE